MLQKMLIVNLRKLAHDAAHYLGTRGLLREATREVVTKGVNRLSSSCVAAGPLNGAFD